MVKWLIDKGQKRHILNQTNSIYVIEETSNFTKTSTSKVLIITIDFIFSSDRISTANIVH